MYQVLSQREFGSGNCRQLIWPEHSQEGVNLEQGARRAEPGGCPRPKCGRPSNQETVELSYLGSEGCCQSCHVHFSQEPALWKRKNMGLVLRRAYSQIPAPLWPGEHVLDLVTSSELSFERMD